MTYNDTYNIVSILRAIESVADELHDGQIVITAGTRSATVTVETGGGDPEGLPGSETVAVEVEGDVEELSKRYCAYRRLDLDEVNYDPFEEDDDDQA